MAIRQYIGARYVLKIYENSQNPLSAEWEANTSYEPLVMVNYNNSSYISRKEVPANIGNPVDNPTYWALSGLYNGQIASLQNRVGALENEYDTPLNTENLDVLVIGDSWGTGQYSTSGKGWCDYLEEILPCNRFFKTAQNGAGFVGYTATFIDLLTTITPNIADKDKIDLIFVGGGLNDEDNSISSIQTAIHNFIDYATTNYPNAKIIIAALNYNLGYDGDSNYYKNTYTQAYKEAMEYNDKVSYTDLRYKASFADFVNRNHLDDQGCKDMAKAVKGCITGVEYGMSFSKMGTYSLHNADTNMDLAVAFGESEDGLFIRFGTINFGNSFQPSSFLSNLEFEGSDILMPFNGSLTFTAMASVSVNGEPSITLPVEFTVTSPTKVTMSILNIGRGNSVSYNQFYVFNSTHCVPKNIM